MGLGRRSRWNVIVAGVAIVAVLAGDGAALAVRESEADAATVLARTTAFVRRNRTVHFEGRVSLEERAWRRRDVGRFSVTRLALEGDASFPERARFTVDYGGSHAEIIVLGRRVWSREADRRGRLDDEKWGREDAGSHDRRSGVVRPQEPTGADPGQPQDLLRLLEQGRRPRLVERGGDGTTLLVELDPEKAFGESGEGADEATLEVTLDGDDDGATPRRAVLRVLGHEVDLIVDYRLSSWGEPVSIAPPSAADVDATPGIDEEEIARFDDALLLQPAAIPAGWVLDLAEVVEGDEDGCDRVDVDYIDPVSDETGYLYLHEMALGCGGTDGEDRDHREAGSEPFTAGDHRGSLRIEDGEVRAELVVGETLIQAVTDLSAEELATVLSRLRPLDLAVTPDPLAGVGRARAGA